MTSQVSDVGYNVFVRQFGVADSGGYMGAWLWAVVPAHLPGTGLPLARYGCYQEYEDQPRNRYPIVLTAVLGGPPMVLNSILLNVLTQHAVAQPRRTQQLYLNERLRSL